MKMSGVRLSRNNKPYRLIRAAMLRTGDEARLPGCMDAETGPVSDQSLRPGGNFSLKQELFRAAESARA
jgi:hypothetical protein